jgi:hypothetical protein
MTCDGGSDELRIDWFTRLTPESATFLPWMCIGGVMREIGEGVLTVGPEDFQAAGLLGACCNATQMVVDGLDDDVVASGLFEQPDTPATRRMFQRVAQGAAELARYEYGAPLVVARFMPAAIDGISMYRQETEQLAWHCSYYWTLALATGTEDRAPEDEMTAALMAVLPPPGPIR